MSHDGPSTRWGARVCGDHWAVVTPRGALGEPGPCAGMRAETPAKPMPTRGRGLPACTRHWEETRRFCLAKGRSFLTKNS